MGQVNRNIERFPERFMHQVTAEEFANLKSQIATSSFGVGAEHLKSQIATSSCGRGFNRNGLQYMRKLYRTFPKCATLSCKLSWREETQGDKVSRKDSHF